LLSSPGRGILCWTQVAIITVSGGSRSSSSLPIVVLVDHYLRCRLSTLSSVGFGATFVRPRRADVVHVASSCCVVISALAFGFDKSVWGLELVRSGRRERNDENEPRPKSWFIFVTYLCPDRTAELSSGGFFPMPWLRPRVMVVVMSWAVGTWHFISESSGCRRRGNEVVYAAGASHVIIPCAGVEFPWYHRPPIHRCWVGYVAVQLISL